MRPASEMSRVPTLTPAAAAKAWIMGSSALAAYTSLDGNFFLQVLIVAITFLVITLPSAGVWLIFGAGLQRFLKDPKHLQIFNLAMALLLIASILPVVWEMLGGTNTPKTSG